MRRTHRTWPVVLVLLGSLTSACGLQTSNKLPFDVEPGSIQPVRELRGVSISVGSKDFTENQILGYLAAIALTAAGADVNDMTNIQGSNSSRQALLSGDVDVSWDYTGTGWISYLGNTDPIPDERRQYEAVRDTDLARNRLVWLDYSPMNDTYAFATTKQFAARHNLRTTSDLAELARKDPSQATFCLETEFVSRNDGFPGVKRVYGFDVPDGNVKIFGTGAVYAAVANGTCSFGEVFTTDGRILSLDLTVLTDDKTFFPQYNAAVVVRKEFLDAHPQVRGLLEPIGRKLNNQVMQMLNAQVDVEGKDPAVVARDWMASQGFIAAKA